MTTLLNTLPDAARKAHLQYGFFDDFVNYNDENYTIVTAADGTVTLTDGAQGGVAIKSAVASAGGNEDCYLISEPEAFLLAADKPIVFEARVQATEDDTNQNNLFVGLTDGAAANLLVDDGAGPKTSGNTICFYKVDGGLNWYAYARDDADADVVNEELNATNSKDGTAHVGSGSAHQTLSIEVLPYGGGTKADIKWYIDGVLVYDKVGWDFGTPSAMQCVAGVKDGDAGDEVTLNLYYWFCYQTR